MSKAVQHDSSEYERQRENRSKEQERMGRRGLREEEVKEREDENERDSGIGQ